VKHTIEPEVQYLFVPESGRRLFSETLPPCARVARPRPGDNCAGTLFSEGYLFDERDTINKRNFLSWGITSRVIGRAASRAEAEAQAAEAAAAEVGETAPARPQRRRRVTPVLRELVKLSLLQGYDVSRELVDTSHLSDVDASVRVQPAPWLTLGYDTTVNFEQGSVRGISTGVGLREPWWQTNVVRQLQSASGIGVSYRFVEQDVNQQIDPDSAEARLIRTVGVNEIAGSVYLRLGSFAGFAFLARYDLSTTPQVGAPPLGPHFLERDYLLRLISRCNCWMLEAGVTERINPKEDPLFRAQLTLVGLGSFGQGPTAPNFVGFGNVPGATGGFASSGGGFY
jgi:hypothetical protein